MDRCYVSSWSILEHNQNYKKMFKIGFGLLTTMKQNRSRQLEIKYYFILFTEISKLSVNFIYCILVQTAVLYPVQQWQ